MSHRTINSHKQVQHSQHNVENGHKSDSHTTDAHEIDTSIALSDAEIENLLYMYQEEKLAMDVYDNFYEQYQVDVFDKISNSELNHMTKIGEILTAYNINIEAYQNLDAGEFLNDELQELYNSLIELGSESVTDALEVGVSIEIIDIADLNEELTNDYVNENIVDVYTHLEDASQNHLDAFTKALDADLYIA